jgi:hypothetical protein
MHEKIDYWVMTSIIFFITEESIFESGLLKEGQIQIRNPFKYALYLIREACLAHKTSIGHVPLLVSQLHLNQPDYRFLFVDEI